ncbi:MAG: response regulator [Rhizobiaceae bacterium]
MHQARAERPGFLAGGGEAAEIVARFDWASTSVGPIESWPQSMRGCLALILRSPVPIVTLWGKDGIMIYNDGYSQFAGGRHPGLFGSKVREGWPEVADFNDNIMKVGLAGGTLAYREQRLVLSRNGQPEDVWLDLDYSPLLDESGRPAGVMAIVVEISDRVEAERRLAAERESLQRMFAQAPGFLAMLSGPEHVFTMANNAYQEMIGGRQVLGLPVREALPEVATQGFIKLLDRVYNTGKPYVGRNVSILLQQRPDDLPREVFIDFIYQPILSDNEVTGIFVQGNDVTEQSRAQSALRESEQRFRLVTENAPVMLWMGDQSGKCVYLNGSQREFWGVEADKVGGFDWTGTIHPDDVESLRGPFAEAMAGHKPLSVEMRLKRADGVYRTVRTNAQPRFGPRGEFLGMIGVNVDVTRIRQTAAAMEKRIAEEVAKRSTAEDALRQAQKMEAIGKLTGGVAHDFNNLLQVISGNLQLLLKDVAGNERASQRVENALSGVGRGSKLASQLLAFGRRQPLEPKVVNAGRLVSGMGDMLRRTIGEGIEVETMVSGGLWNTLIDPGQLENAVLNLAINARDAMGDEGKLTIEVGNAFLDDAYVLQHTDVAAGQYVVLAVSDTGTGIPAEIMNQVFEPFFSTKPHGKGTGLGLSMVYGFVKQSGGHVKVYSELGHGTTVKLYLPRSSESEDWPANVASGPVTGGTETVLVAEDDDEVRATVLELLSDLGYRVLTARDAASALSVVESGIPIDLLFTDVVMPGTMRSPELARKARERLPDIAVLFTSGYTENSIVHGGRLDAGVDLLSKPYTREALARKIRHVLSNATQRKAAIRMAGEAGAETRPAAQAEPEPAEATPDTLTILLCEDDAIIRINTADMLQDAGMTVLEAANGNQALAVAASTPFDMLVTDVGLPDITGLELAVKIREQRPDLPVLFATGHTDVPGSEALARAAVISKPYDEQGLLEKIRQLTAG